VPSSLCASYSPLPDRRAPALQGGEKSLSQPVPFSFSAISLPSSPLLEQRAYSDRGKSEREHFSRWPTPQSLSFSQASASVSKLVAPRWAHFYSSLMIMLLRTLSQIFFLFANILPLLPTLFFQSTEPLRGGKISAIMHFAPPRTRIRGKKFLPFFFFLPVFL